MASVWAARQHGKHGFEKLVAVKTILPGLARQARFRSMFLDEARIASRVDHPNVARILDVGEEKDLLYLVMEWVDGDSLWSLWQRLRQQGRTMPAGIALRILADLCGGLHAVHELRDATGARLSVVHRDVSPENILIDRHGTARLIDFGVAKAKNRFAEETMTGVLKGKLHYMAPEQATFRPVDRRTDVWAVGAILYRLFAGVPPYRGDTREATLLLLGSGQKPAPLPPTVPLVVAAVAERALMYNRDERFATAADLKAALEAALVSIHARTSTADVAEYVCKLMADVIEARRAAMSQSLRASPRPSQGRGDEAKTKADRQAPTIPDVEEDDGDVPTSVLDWPKLPPEAEDPLFSVLKAVGAPDMTFEAPSVRRSSHRSWRALLVSAIVAAGVLAAAFGRRERAQPLAGWGPAVAGPRAAPTPPAPPSAAALPPLRAYVGPQSAGEVHPPNFTSPETKRAAVTSEAPSAARPHQATPRPRRVVKTPRASPIEPPPAASEEPVRPLTKPSTPVTSAVDDGF
jgi:serine/threonine-protein kinase